MMKYNLIKNSKLHDYELLNITINYQNASVQFEMRDTQNKICQLDINSFIPASNEPSAVLARAFGECREVFDFYVNEHDEPWGKGKYIVSSDVIMLDDFIRIEIQLNSGDTCIIHKLKEELTELFLYLEFKLTNIVLESLN